jgi:hypothetical protein
MSKRNMIWLVVVLAVGALAWLAFGLVVGLIATVLALVLSEVIERAARRKRRAAQPGR